MVRVAVIVDGPRDLEREAREPLGHPLHGRLRGVGWEGVFTLQTELERPAATGPTHHLLRSHCTICPDMTGADALLAVGEDEGLRKNWLLAIFLFMVGKEPLTHRQHVDHAHDHGQDTC